MTDSEYKEFAKQVIDDLLQKDTINNSEDSQPISISHVGEVFLIKIIEAVALLDEASYLYEGAYKLKNKFEGIIEVYDVSDNIGYLHPIGDKSILFINIGLFFGIYSAIQSHTAPEYMLQSFGVEDPEELIAEINKAVNINKQDDFLDSIKTIIHKLTSSIETDKLLSLILWGTMAFMGSSLIKICKEKLADNIFDILSLAKYVYEYNPSVYEERIAYLYYNLKSMIGIDGINFSYIPESYLSGLLANNIEELTEGDGNYLKYGELALNHPFIFLDFMFFCYYIVYQKPQCIVKFGFSLMSSNSYSAIGNTLFSTFKKDDYAALIQYEYKWWCKETSNSLSLPFPFYEKNINLNELGVIDYELAESVITDNSQLPDSHLCPLPEYYESSNNSGETIFNSLKDYLLNMREEDRYKAGTSFRNNHLTKVINTARNLKDRYSVYGFAWILFNSKYFNWKGRVFNQGFVMDIANIFNIDGRLLEGKGYNQSKSREKAKQMLSKNEMSYLNAIMKEHI